MSTTNGMPLASVFPLKKKTVRGIFAKVRSVNQYLVGLECPRNQNSLAVFLQQRRFVSDGFEVCGLLLDDFSLYFHINIIPLATEKYYYSKKIILFNPNLK